MRYRPYQIEDAKFLAGLKSGACFNEQRTGKTPTALGVVRLKGFTKILIICPASAMFAWKAEYEAWLGKPCLVVYGTVEKKHKIVEQWTDGLVVSYDTFKYTSTREGFIKDILREHPEMVIVDEIHRIAGLNTAVARSIFYLAYRIEHKLALTGTPAPAHAQNIWSIMHFLFPRKYRGYWSFVEEYFVYEEQLLRSGDVHKNIQGVKYSKEQELAKLLDTFSTMRKRRDIMQWLPEKDPPTIIKLPLTAKQEKYLEELQQYFEISESSVVTKGILDRLIRYRQICLAPELLGLKGDSPKIDWIKQYIKDYPERQIIIFSSFTQFLKLLQEKLSTGQLIIGETPLKKRAEYCKQFQAGTIKILLINIQAGKEALTLDAATRTIFTDKYPPIGDIEQAEARFVATTIDKKDKPTEIIELMMENSYDAEIYDLLRQRKTEVDIINNYNKYLGGRPCQE